MKKDIHPQYNQAEVSCACGNTFKVGSVLKKIDIEICNECHPFYSGKEKIIDTAGRVERFNKKREMAAVPKKKKIRKKNEK
jgi:large subunit ribosomal protein L31